MADNEGGSFDALPEGCIAAIVAFTTPRDACRLAAVSKVFWSASESDVVWERFMQSDCELIVARSDGGEALMAEFQSKKQLYMHLANRPLLLHDDIKSLLSWREAEVETRLSWIDADDQYPMPTIDRWLGYGDEIELAVLWR